MRFFVIIAAVLLFTSLTGLSCIPVDNTTVRPEVSVLHKELKPDADGKTALLVIVKNTGRVKADLVEVAVKFYDADKNLLDANRDSVMTLNADETWEFTIPCGASLNKIASYEIETMAGSGGE